MTDHERLRFEAREAVIFNPDLSAGACRLYVALDSMAGYKGQCWPNQVVLAKRLGTTDRMLRRWLVELKGLVRTLPRPGTSMYVLAWLKSGRKPMAVGRALMSDLPSEGRTLVSGQVGHPCPTSSLFTEPGKLTSKQQARRIIEKYPHAQHLLGQPSDGLVDECLTLAGGLDPLGEALRAMFLAEKRPDLSWAWFRTVIPSYLRRRA